MDQAHRGPITNCTVRPQFVVLPASIFYLFAGIVRIEKPILAEALEPYRGIEASRIRVSVGFPGRLKSNVTPFA